jgi:hypothetical protein
MFTAEIRTPIAIPVYAECPSASEKKDRCPFTTIVPNNANNGIIINIDSNASLINEYSNKLFPSRYNTRQIS